MERFRCHYCKRSEQEFADIILHLTTNHEDVCMKYREKELNVETGRFGYRTKTFDHIIPKDGEVFITEDDKVGIYRDDRSKKKKLNTPVKEHLNDSDTSDGEMDVNVQFNGIDEEDQCDGGIDLLDDEQERNEALEELERVLPSMLQNLQLSGHMQLYIKWSSLIAENKFPMNNICYSLFLDLIEWYSNPTTSRMRYSRYRLFKGKFLRFMSGPRSLGQIVSGEQDKGMCSVQDTRINFAVPSLKTLTKDKLQPIMPGILDESITALAGQFSSKFLKLGVDGKTIAKGKGKVMGDIDCWGYEAEPTLHERVQRQELEKTIILKLRTHVENYQLDDESTMPILAGERLQKGYVKIIQIIAIRLENLRSISLRLDFGIRKFMVLAEGVSKDWNQSKYAPIISSLKVAKYDVSEAISTALELVNEICQTCSIVNGQASEYSFSGQVDLPKTSFNHQLKTGIEVCDAKLVKQKSDEWFGIRKEAKVTGSTCTTALGLGQLKQQQAHFDKVVSGKVSADPFSEEQRKNMAYGSKHEIDGVATMVRRVLPALFPNLQFFEEGCATLENQGQTSFLVASPDGSFKTALQSEPKMMFENKCKVDNPYSTPVYYKIPKYYVPQVLCEMRAYNCSQLLFSCWSTKSTTVFMVAFDEKLWAAIWEELSFLYATEKPKRPSKFSENVVIIREMINEFLERNVTLVGEFPSCFSSSELQEVKYNGDGFHTAYHHIQSEDEEVEHAKTENILNTIHKLLKWHENVYNLCRTSATEILMFMLNDLDRNFHMEICNAHPVAYALKGPSMSTEMFGKMVDKVINQCEKRGLKIIATASDGQWHKYGIRSSNNEPLTLFQLQKDVWGIAKSKSKQQLQSDVRNRYKVQSLYDVVFTKDPMKGTVIVEGHRHDRPFVIYRENLKYWCFNVIDKHSDSSTNRHDHRKFSSVNDISSFVPETATISLNNNDSLSAELILSDIDNSRINTCPVFNTQPILQNLGNLFHEFDLSETPETTENELVHRDEAGRDFIMTADSMEINRDTISSYPQVNNSEMSGQSTTLDIMHDAYTTIYGDFDFDNSFTQQSHDEVIAHNREFVRTTTSDQYAQSLFVAREQGYEINDTTKETPKSSILGELLLLLQTDSTRKDHWQKNNSESFQLLFESKEAICKAFHQRELVMLLRTLAKREVDTVKFYTSWNKVKLSELLFNIVNRCRHVTTESVSRKRIRKLNPPQLKKIVSNLIGKFPKETLAIALCNDHLGKQT